MSNEDFTPIESSLPKSWEQEETFNDVLYDWMSRAPWLAISAAAHLVIFLIIAAIPWNLFDTDDPTEIQTALEQPPPPEFEGDRRRRYYSVSEFGRVAAAGESERLRRLLVVAVAQNLAPGRTG